MYFFELHPLTAASFSKGKGGKVQVLASGLVSVGKSLNCSCAPLHSAASNDSHLQSKLIKLACRHSCGRKSDPHV